MSFSSDAKYEIMNKSFIKQQDAISELGAMICFSGKLKHISGGYSLSVLTENPKIARRIYSLLKGALDITSVIKIKKTSDKTSFYEVYLDDRDKIEYLLKKMYLFEDSLDKLVSFHIDEKLIDTDDKRISFLRGAFIIGGSVINPQKGYHLEFATGRYGVANDFSALLTRCGIPAKMILRKSKYVMYYKNSEAITDVLTVLGAVNALMEYHNTKILKEMRNNVNRTINCESANLNKIVDASLEQVMCIEKLIKKNQFDSLPQNLQDIAKLRLENRECSLKELGEMLNPPIGRSGVNHRLRKLIEIANNL